MTQKFDFHKVQNKLAQINKALKNQGDVPIAEFCQILDEFCVLFAQMSSVLGMAFSDIKGKSIIIRHNQTVFPGHKGFFSFVKIQMQKNLQNCNGDNNKSQKAPEQFKKYNSTARNLLRMMWFFTFLKSTFQQVEQKPPKTKIEGILDVVYDTAFGDKHSWLVRKGAKLAIATGSDRKTLVTCLLGQYNQQKLKQQNPRFLKQLVPVHDALWDFFKKNKITDLE